MAESFVQVVKCGVFYKSVTDLLVYCIYCILFGVHVV